jgi:hypothetical protein
MEGAARTINTAVSNGKRILDLFILYVFGFPKNHYTGSMAGRFINKMANRKNLVPNISTPVVSRTLCRRVKTTKPIRDATSGFFCSSFR